MERCNSKPQPLPEYIKENVNVADSNTIEEIKINLGTLPDDELLAIINRVSKIHSGGSEEENHLLKIYQLPYIIHNFRICWRAAEIEWASHSSRIYAGVVNGESRKLAPCLSELLHPVQHGPSGDPYIGGVEHLRRIRVGQR